MNMDNNKKPLSDRQKRLLEKNLVVLTTEEEKIKKAKQIAFYLIVFLIADSGISALMILILIS